MNPGKLLALKRAELRSARSGAQCSAKLPLSTTGPGLLGRLLVSRVSSIVWYLPASLGSSAPPCRLPLAPTSGLRLSASWLVGELYSHTA